MAAVVTIEDRYLIEVAKWSYPDYTGLAQPKWWVCKCKENEVWVWRVFSLTPYAQSLSGTFYNKFRTVFENDLAIDSDVYQQYLVGVTSAGDPGDSTTVGQIFAGTYGGALTAADITLLKEVDDAEAKLFTVAAGAVWALYCQVNFTTS